MSSFPQDSPVAGSAGPVSGWVCPDGFHNCDLTVHRVAHPSFEELLTGAAPPFLALDPYAPLFRPDALPAAVEHLGRFHQYVRAEVLRQLWEADGDGYEHLRSQVLAGSSLWVRDQAAITVALTGTDPERAFRFVALAEGSPDPTRTWAFAAASTIPAVEDVLLAHGGRIGRQLQVVASFADACRVHRVSELRLTRRALCNAVGEILGYLHHVRDLSADDIRVAGALTQDWSGSLSDLVEVVTNLR